MFSNGTLLLVITGGGGGGRFSSVLDPNPCSANFAMPGRGNLVTGKICHGKIWHNKSVPIYAMVFQV